MSSAAVQVQTGFFSFFFGCFEDSYFWRIKERFAISGESLSIKWLFRIYHSLIWRSHIFKKKFRTSSSLSESTSKSPESSSISDSLNKILKSSASVRTSRIIKKMEYHSSQYFWRTAFTLRLLRSSVSWLNHSALFLRGLAIILAVFEIKRFYCDFDFFFSMNSVIADSGILIERIFAPGVETSMILISPFLIRLRIVLVLYQSSIFSATWRTVNIDSFFVIRMILENKKIIFYNKVILNCKTFCIDLHSFALFTHHLTPKFFIDFSFLHDR